MRTRLAFVLAALSLLAPVSALARAWHGVTPGTTSLNEVQKRFGVPTKLLTQGKKQVLAYEGDETIEGTKQAQFIIGADGIVEQIVIFPATVVEKAVVVTTYGPDCATKQVANCYVQKVNDDDFRSYFWFEGLGLVVFFDAEGKTVQSLIYTRPAAKASAVPAK